jgi:hypothetical protein
MRKKDNGSLTMEFCWEIKYKIRDQDNALSFNSLEPIPFTFHFYSFTALYFYLIGIWYLCPCTLAFKTKRKG